MIYDMMHDSGLFRSLPEIFIPLNEVAEVSQVTSLYIPNDGTPTTLHVKMTIVQETTFEFERSVEVSGPADTWDNQVNAQLAAEDYSEQCLAEVGELSKPVITRWAAEVANA